VKDNIEEKLDLIICFEKRELIVDVYHNIRLACTSSVCTIHDNAVRIKKSSKSGTKVFVCVASPVGMDCTRNYR
jgi:hypothetical protein